MDAQDALEIRAYNQAIEMLLLELVRQADERSPGRISALRAANIPGFDGPPADAVNRHLAALLARARSASPRRQS